MEYATLSARIASFPTTCKRSKSGWPHKSPSIEDVAKAGFYYKPQGAGSDNVVCYLCERSLDGWEADDDPVQEHLRHSPECGWAIMMSHAQAEKYDTDEMEDPTSVRLADARRVTFVIGWPHESKRAWVCKTEKMVEAGWHFAPTEECDDFVSCAYCKLSLDGWEPKDNPFDEHYRRNPECPFFVFAGTTAPSKRPKAKKGRASKSARTSKASTRLSTRSNRLSTQSNVSILSESEAPSMTDIPDLDESIDTSTTSVMSNMSTASTATNKGKRKAAGGRKASKSKKAKTARSTRGKKAEPEPEPEPEPEQEPEEVIEVLDPEPETEEPLQPMPEIESQGHDESIPSMIPSPTPVAEDQPAMGQPQPSQPSRQRARKQPSRSPQQQSPPPTSESAPPYHMQATVPQSPHHHTSPPLPTSPSKSPTPQALSPSTSDVENAPPSTRPASVRPPAPSSLQSPPLGSPSLIEQNSQWQPIDIDLVFQSTPAESFLQSNAEMSEQEKQMTVQEWIEHVAGKAEEELKMEGERVVSVFEREGTRAMRVLEGIECV